MHACVHAGLTHRRGVGGAPLLPRLRQKMGVCIEYLLQIGYCGCNGTHPWSVPRASRELDSTQLEPIRIMARQQGKKFTKTNRHWGVRLKGAVVAGITMQARAKSRSPSEHRDPGFLTRPRIPHGTLTSSPPASGQISASPSPHNRSPIGELYSSSPMSRYSPVSASRAAARAHSPVRSQQQGISSNALVTLWG